MLRHLRLRDFVILAEAALDFDPGMNVVTGETGTGKSILVDAIGFLAGGRADSAFLREGAGEVAVEAVFDIDRLPEAAAAAKRLGAPAAEGRLTLRRALSSSGRGRAWIQDRPVRIADLREMGELLLAIHGQGEHRRLLDPAAQVELIDRFARALPARETYAAARRRWLEAIARETEATARLAALAAQEDWLRAQIEEIDAARPAAGEEARLRERIEEARHRARAIALRGEVEGILFEEDGSAADRIETALHRTSDLTDEWRALREELAAAREALRRARRLLPPAADAAGDEEESAAAEERLALLARLRRKYGGSEESVLDRRGAAASQLEEIEALRVRLPRLAREREQEAEAAAEAAAALQRLRREAAAPIARAVGAELAVLGMPGASLEVDLQVEEAGAGAAITAAPAEVLRLDGRPVRAFADGVDRGGFRLRPNPGEGAGPLGDVASGGELSRTMLALLSVLGGREEPRTAIFDEVDAGIGGAAARAVAARLERLAGERQVLLVTHLPLIAARASGHFRVDKQERSGRTIARVERLARDGRITEIARMLHGEVASGIARRHAEELLAEGEPGSR